MKDLIDLTRMEDSEVAAILQQLHDNNNIEAVRPFAHMFNNTIKGILLTYDKWYLNKDNFFIVLVKNTIESYKNTENKKLQKDIINNFADIIYNNEIPWNHYSDDMQELLDIILSESRYTLKVLLRKINIINYINKDELFVKLVRHIIDSQIEVPDIEQIWTMYISMNTLINNRLKNKEDCVAVLLGELSYYIKNMILSTENIDNIFCLCKMCDTYKDETFKNMFIGILRSLVEEEDVKAICTDELVEYDILNEYKVVLDNIINYSGLNDENIDLLSRLIVSRLNKDRPIFTKLFNIFMEKLIKKDTVKYMGLPIALSELKIRVEKSIKQIKSTVEKLVNNFIYIMKTTTHDNLMKDDRFVEMSNIYVTLYPHTDFNDRISQLNGNMVYILNDDEYLKTSMILFPEEFLNKLDNLKFSDISEPIVSSFVQYIDLLFAGLNTRLLLACVEKFGTETNHLKSIKELEDEPYDIEDLKVLEILKLVYSGYDLLGSRLQTLYMYEYVAEYIK